MLTARKLNNLPFPSQLRVFFPLLSADGPALPDSQGREGRKEKGTGRGETNPCGAMQCWGRILRWASTEHSTESKSATATWEQPWAWPCSCSLAQWESQLLTKMDYTHSQDMLDFHQCRDLLVLLHYASRYTFLLDELNFLTHCAFQLKGRTQIHNRVIFLFKKTRW